MLISKTTLLNAQGQTVVLFGDIHLPYLKEQEQAQLERLVSLAKEVPDSLFMLECTNDLGNKSLLLAYPNEAARNSANFMLLGETKKALDAQGISFIDLGKQRPGADYMSFGGCINTIIGQAAHFMSEDEAVARVKAEITDLCPAHFLGTAEEWKAHAQKEIDAEKEALKKINPATPAPILAQAKERINGAQSLLTAAYKAAKSIRSNKKESFLSIVAHSLYNYHKNAQKQIGAWDRFKWAVGLDSRGIFAHRVFFNYFFGFGWRTTGFTAQIHYALADMDFAALGEVQKTTAKNIFIAAGTAHCIILKHLFKGIGFLEESEECTLFAQVPNLPAQELKKLPDMTSAPEFTRLVQVLVAQFGEVQLAGVYELPLEAKANIGKQLDIFGLTH